MNLISKSWKRILEKELKKDYFHKLMLFVDNEYNKETVYPPKELIFSAFNLCDFDDIKVVIIGQDPYHGLGQADGLCFSISCNKKIQPSLKNIFKELQNQYKVDTPSSGNLQGWAKQGVFLLNTILTVREGKAGSHKNKGWETFTDSVIKTISDKKDNIIFLLWGGYAKKKIKLIDRSKHHILESGHPSPLSANRGFWFGNNHFKRTNDLLKKMSCKEISWL